MSTRTFIRMSAVVAVLAASFVSRADAQLGVEVEAGPFVGGTMFLADPVDPITISRQGAPPVIVERGQLENAITVGVHAGVRFADRVGLEGTYAWVPTRLSAGAGLEAQGGAVDVNAIRYGLLTTYHFSPLGRLQPFAGLGVTGETLSYGPHLGWQRHSSVSGALALGGNLWLSDGLFLRLGAARDVLTRGDERPRHQFMVTAGVNARQRVR